MLKQITFVLSILLLSGLCACGSQKNKASSTENSPAASGNFSSEMIIEDSSDVTIVEVP